MAVPIKLFLELGIAAAGIALATATATISFSKKYQIINKRHGLYIDVCNEQQKTIKDVHDFFRAINYDDVMFTDYPFGNSSFEKPLSFNDKLAEMLREYKSNIISLNSCFERYTSAFSDKYDKMPDTKWNDWDDSMKALFREISILSDHILDVCTPLTAEQLTVGYIGALNDRISAVLAQYSSQI